MNTKIVMIAITALSITSIHAASMTHKGRSVLEIKKNMDALCPDCDEQHPILQNSKTSETTYAKVLLINFIQKVLTEKDCTQRKILLQQAKKLAVTKNEQKQLESLTQLLNQ